MKGRHPTCPPKEIKEEVRKILDAMSCTYLLMAKLLYSPGLRLMECLRLRVKDIDFEQNQITVRDGFGNIYSLQNHYPKTREAEKYAVIISMRVACEGL